MSQEWSTAQILQKSELEAIFMPSIQRIVYHGMVQTWNG